MVLQLIAQCMYRARIMGLHAALRAAHGRGRGRDIQAFPGTQQKCLLLTQWQGAECGFERCAGACMAQLLFRAACSRIGQCGERIFIIVVVGAQPRQPAILRAPPPVPVANAALQDAVEQRPPFFRIASAVMAREREHGVLHNVERLIPVTGGELRHAEGASFDTGKETLQTCA